MFAIENLTRSEKLRLLEALWDDLVPDKTVLAFPAWHGDAFKAAEEAQASGKACFVDWEAAKQGLLDLAKHEN